MDSATTSLSAPSRNTDSSTRSTAQRSSTFNGVGNKQTSTPPPKLADPSVTVKGRFDPDLRRFFVTILDTSSQLLIAQFPSQAVARYVQQLKKVAAEGETAPTSAENGPPQNETIGSQHLNRTT